MSSRIVRQNDAHPRASSSSSSHVRARGNPIAAPDAMTNDAQSTHASSDDVGVLDDDRTPLRHATTHQATADVVRPSASAVSRRPAPSTRSLTRTAVAPSTRSNAQSYVVVPTQRSTANGSRRGTREPSASLSTRARTPTPSFAIPSPRQRVGRLDATTSERQVTPASNVVGVPVASSSSSSSHLSSAALSTRSLNAAKAMKAPRGSKPALPLSAYRLFSVERRPTIEQDAASPTGPRYNVNQAVRAEWNSLDATQRTPYEDEAAKRKREYEASMEAWREIYGDQQKEGRTRRGPNDHGALNAKPNAPKNAYMLFKADWDQRHAVAQTKKDSGSGAISTAWHALAETERQAYRKRADEARQTYEHELDTWRRAHPEAAAMTATDEQEDGAEGEGEAHKSKKVKRPKRRTVSDDETEYLAEVAEHGAALLSRRLDDQATSMFDLSEKTFNKGRASQKTFEMERKLRQGKRERAQIRKRMRQRNVRTEEELYALEGRPIERPTSTIKRRMSLEPMSDVEEDATTDGNVTATEGEDDGDDEDGAQSDAESLGAASTSTHHTLREKKFSVQTRIVDGKIVLDETSLQQSQNDQAGVYGSTTEFVDVIESDRFVNSATHAKRKVRNDRWLPSETEEFLRAVSMWGSDFEMISRMFPLRDRSQIRSKWHSMERTDKHSLDLAFKTRLPIDLPAYGQMAGVDLSGDAPQIEIRPPVVAEKSEDDANRRREDGLGDAEHEARVSAATDDVAVKKKREVEYDENGLEIVDEDDETDAPDPSVLPWAAQRSAPTMRPPVVPASQSEQRQAHVGKTSGKARSGSKTTTTAADGTAERTRRARSSSTTSHAGTAVSGMSTSAAHAASSAAVSDRERKQRRMMDEERKQRERSRRRPLPTGEEEIVEE